MNKHFSLNSSKLLAVATLALLSFPAFAQDYSVPVGTADYIRKAVESPGRGSDARDRDANRLPAEVLALSGIKPGDSIIEFAGFGQYYTTMMSDIVGDDGSIVMFDLPYTEARAGDASRAFTASHANTDYVLVNYNDIDLPQNADLAFNVLYYHDLPLNDIDTAVLNQRIYDALKPGGIFMIIDHNARAGSGTTDTESLHRIDPEVIKQQLTAVGFILAAESDLLAHPEDDHTQMVFTPGVRGLTDRTVYKFQKPE